MTIYHLLFSSGKINSYLKIVDKYRFFHVTRFITVHIRIWIVDLKNKVYKVKNILCAYFYIYLLIYLPLVSLNNA